MAAGPKEQPASSHARIFFIRLQGFEKVVSVGWKKKFVIVEKGDPSGDPTILIEAVLIGACLRVPPPPASDAK